MTRPPDLVEEFDAALHLDQNRALALLRERPALVTANLENLDAATGSKGVYAVHLAAWYDPPTVLAYLLASGASPHVRTRTTLSTPLHEAAEANNPAGIELLLGAGADIDAPDQCDWTPLDRCIADQREAFDFLLAHGADPGLLPAVAWNRVDLIDHLLATRSLEDLLTRVCDLQLLFTLATFHPDADAVAARLRAFGFVGEPLT